MASDDKFGEGSNYFSSYKIGGVKGNTRGPNVQGATNPGIRAEPTLDDKGNQLYDDQGFPKQNVVLQPTFVDGSDALANRGFTISFQSVINGKTTAFKAYVTAFNETYNSNWTSEEVYGRADPIYMFKNTTRNITVSFMVPASTEGEAYENLTKTQELIQKLYPAYTNVQRAQTIAQSPLVRMKVVNLTQRQIRGTNEDVQGEGFTTAGAPIFSMSPDVSNGLLGLIKNVSINHHIDDPNVGVFEIRNGVILPKLIEIQIEFAAIHEMPLAQEEVWMGTGDFETFPYGMQNASYTLDKAKIAQEMDEMYSAWTKTMQDQREAERNREMGDQAMENAQARYAGLFGKSRFDKDKRRLQNGRIKNDEKRRYIQESVIGQQMRDDGADASAHSTYASNYDMDMLDNPNASQYMEPEYNEYGEIIN